MATYFLVGPKILWISSGFVLGTKSLNTDPPKKQSEIKSVECLFWIHMGHFLIKEIFCKRLNSDIVALLRMQSWDAQCGEIIYEVVKYKDLI